MVTKSGINLICNGRVMVATRVQKRMFRPGNCFLAKPYPAIALVMMEHKEMSAAVQMELQGQRRDGCRPGKGFWELLRVGFFGTHSGGTAIVSVMVLKGPVTIQ